MHRLLLFIAICCGLDVTCAATVDTLLVTPGCRYVGQYPSGEGVLYSDSRGLFIGHFEKGKPAEVCTHYLMNGSVYHGEFRDELYSGFGKYFPASGEIIVGEFREGAANGVDTIYYQKNAVYVGKCVNGKPNGDGVLYKYEPQRRKYYFEEGQFANGRLINGFRQTLYGLSSVVKGRGNRAVDEDTMYSQDELMRRYLLLRGNAPKRPKRALTKEQQDFLKGKLNSSQIR